jgi:hypothetical protein
MSGRLGVTVIKDGQELCAFSVPAALKVLFEEHSLVTASLSLDLPRKKSWPLGAPAYLPGVHFSILKEGVA